jgi:hypothetical protein
MGFWERIFGRGEREAPAKARRAGGESEPKEGRSLGPSGKALDEAGEKGYMDPSAGGEAAAREQQIAARRRNR